MSKANRIFIVGHSGAGKGVLAQAIAEELGWQYIDADFALEPSIGRPLSDILSKEGTKPFYKCLADILANQTSKQNIVVTTDDGIVCDEKCRDILSGEFTVYLSVSPSVQLDRISHNRPLLPTENYKDFLGTLRDERDSHYEQIASFSLSSDNGDIPEHTKQVIESYNKAR